MTQVCKPIKTIIFSGNRTNANEYGNPVLRTNIHEAYRTTIEIRSGAQDNAPLIASPISRLFGLNPSRYTQLLTT